MNASRDGGELTPSRKDRQRRTLAGDTHDARAAPCR
jgi:hypothetical protein